MEIFESNMAFLKKKHPGEWEKISGAQDMPNQAELVFKNSDKPNLKLNLSENLSIYFHDADKPGRECDSFLSRIGEESTGVMIILGLGLGYSALEIVRRLKKIKHIIIFELNIEFFLCGLNHLDLSDLLTDNRVILSLGDPGDVSDILKPANRGLMLEDIHTYKLTACFQANNAYEQLAASVFNYASDCNMEGSTKTIHGQQFFENRIKHLTSIHHDNLLEELSYKFKGIPALIVAAGPSLDKNIDEISRAVGKAVIISVDAALPSLLARGIKPDFVTAIDYQELTYEKIAGVAANPLSRDINLICTSWVTPVVPKVFPAKNIFWAFGHHALESWINTSLGGELAVGAAGTVAHLNFISAKVMGCDPVIFVGQDLAFSENKDHSSNVVLTNKESMDTMLKDGRNILWVKGVNGPDVPTTRVFFSYKLAFEEMIEGAKGKFINATEGGAVIEGTENITLASAIERFCKNPVVVDEEVKPKKTNLEKSMRTTLNKLKNLEKIIDKADRLSVSVLRDVDKLKGNGKRLTSLSKLPLKLQKKIVDLDSCHNRADKNQLWSIFDDMTMDGMREDEREKKEIETLEKEPEKYLEWLSKSVVRTDRVNKLRIKNLTKFKKQLNELIVYHNNEKALLAKIERNNPNSQGKTGAAAKTNNKNPFPVNPQLEAPIKAEVQDILELTRIYYQSEDYVLLEKLLVRYSSGLDEFAEINFYLGVIALFRSEYEKANNYFKSALTLDSSYKERIFDKGYEIADFYFKKAVPEGKTIPSDAYSNRMRNLLLRGLKCCSYHKNLKAFFRKVVEYDMQTARQSLETQDKEKIETNRQIFENLVGTEINEKEFQNSMDKFAVANFYHVYGDLLIEEKEYQKALDSFQKALTDLPDEPGLYISITDTYFALGDFNSGLETLKKAVDLDKNYAVYWDNIGDILQAQKDYNGAIMAYERYFLALPEQVGALKKIGDCYKNLDNLEAALEAYRQFKKLAAG
ncbi:6-hydroxymethylpterin diphosphokinase MptE-like protein [Desulfobacter hydrogenophilus]|nr:6-hydroxymethylpterin diphosphokinase MptE-like protein [Desulfobacter hydrogenophilus]NDY70478.1 DUF115 domain-containing protein [Desulfobacter hydrogenophilus]